MHPIADLVDYALPAEFGIYTVAQVRRELVEALDAHGPHLDGTLVIDAREVEQPDAAALQLLVVLAADLRRRGMRLQVRDPSAPLERVIRRFGAASALGLPAAASTV
jgi:anti-anti-sigma regulatory factor